MLSPRPVIDADTIASAALFSQVSQAEFQSMVTSGLQSMLFSDTAAECPQEMRPAPLKDSVSATDGQVITDKQLKVLRKWLTKSFAVNHTDRQAVKRLQMRLNHLGYLADEAISMIYDQDTANAVQRFQVEHEINADGIPTKKTLMEVFGIMNSMLSGE